MYPDPITPRAHPDLLTKVDYDPFHVMPASLPPAPRVFVTAARLERARRRVAEGCAVDRACLAQLVAACQLDEPLPALKPADGPPDWGGPLVPWLNAAFHNALAWALTDEPRHRGRALEALRLAAQAVSHVTTWSGHEHHEAETAARAYDLLVASGLNAADDRAFRDMLAALLTALDHGGHRGCNNHNSMQMVGRLSLAVALGDQQQVHDVFYGCQRRGRWRYGLIHLLRHDFLADGMQWEGVPGYHMLVLMMVAECFTIMESLGVDLWHRAWPTLRQDDGFDEHRGWGPKGTKSLTAAFDALLYQAFANGDYSLLHDQVLGNLRGAWVWWRLFNKAYEVYGEARYAWALRHINRGVSATADGPLPVWFADGQGAVEFVRMEGRDLPAGEHPLARDRAFSLTGRHEAGCSLFPMHGSVLLRSDPLDERGLGAYLYWGPHSAGHRAPAALHLDIHALGRRVTTAPHLYQAGYGDPRHLTWHRTTIAHNTVTVDEHPMFPFDFETESLWECDHWRDTISDGVLESFQPEADFKAVRASNDDVYPGVKLDRTVVLTRRYLLDVYRVTADRPHILDWAAHCHGVFAPVAGGEAVDMGCSAARSDADASDLPGRGMGVSPVPRADGQDARPTRLGCGQAPALGAERGYRHLTDAWQHPQQAGWLTVLFTLGSEPARCVLWLDGAPGARLIVARDPEPDGRNPIGDLNRPEPRTCLIVRSRAAAALFVSVWSFGASVAEGVSVAGTADGDVTVALRDNGQPCRWHLPARGEVRLT